MAMGRPMERVELWNLTFTILSSRVENGVQLSPAALHAFRRWDEHEERRRAVHEGRPKMSRRFREGIPLLDAHCERIERAPVLADNLSAMRC